jgi:type II secretory pathway pseudopilin PulG
MRRRRGFSLFEAVISAAILAILGAAIVPSVVSYRTQLRLRDTANDLLEIGAAVQKYQLAANVGFYPGRLSHLSTEFVPGTDVTSCNTTYTAAGTTVVRWRVGGPYITRLIPTTGLKFGVGVANNVLERSSPSGTVGSLLLRIPQVDYEDAILLNDIIDGPLDIETVDRRNIDGAIRWPVIPSTTSTVSLLFVMPIAKTC